MMYKIELSEEHLRVISEALGNTALRLALPVVTELQRQIREQQPKPNGYAEEALSAKQ